MVRAITPSDARYSVLTAAGGVHLPSMIAAWGQYERMNSEKSSLGAGSQLDILLASGGVAET